MKDYDAILFMCRIVEAHDGITGHHVERVKRISVRIAKAIGIDEEESEYIGRAAQIHDIGKIQIPAHILRKPGTLTPGEYEIVKQHPVLGAKIIAARKYNSFFHLASEIILTHHERWDGTGYPYGLKMEEIPLPGRIVTIADVFDALTHERHYKPAWPVNKVVDYIKQESGKMFDPSIVDILFSSDKLRHIFKTGNIS